MAENMTGMLVENTLVVGSGAKRSQGGVSRIRVVGAVVVILAVLLIGGLALRDQERFHPATTVIPPAGVSTAQYYDDLMSQQEDYIHTMAARATMRQAAAQYDDLMAQQDDFLHTMAARADARLTILGEQQRFLEQNTITLPSAAGAPATTTEQRECTSPAVGFPTCFRPQADGTWVREEFASTGTNWIVVGTVTLDEVVAAFGNLNTIAP